MTYVGFRADGAPFSNELVRKAFSHAIDREALWPPGSTASPRRGEGRRDPSGDAGPLAQGRPVVRPGARPQAPRGRRLPGGQGAPRGATRRLDLEGLRRRARRPVARGAARSQGARIEGHLWAIEHRGHRHVALGLDGRLPGSRRLLPRPLQGSGWPLYMDAEIEEIFERARALENTTSGCACTTSSTGSGCPSARRSSLYAARCWCGPWIEDLWTTPLTRLQLDQVVVGRPGRRAPLSPGASAPPRVDASTAKARASPPERERGRVSLVRPHGRRQGALGVAAASRSAPRRAEGPRASGTGRPARSSPSAARSARRGPPVAMTRRLGAELGAHARRRCRPPGRRSRRRRPTGAPASVVLPITVGARRSRPS